MLERELVLAGQGGGGAAAYEVAVLKDLEVRHGPLEQLAHRPCPEDASDHRRRLKGRFLGASEQIDAAAKTAWTESGMAGPG